MTDAKTVMNNASDICFPLLLAKGQRIRPFVVICGSSLVGAALLGRGELWVQLEIN